jgi:DNA polymerase III epsilon subunit-like protein
MTAPALILHFVDTETTGLIDDYPDAEITEIAVVTWESNNGDRAELLHAPLRPKKKPPDDIAVHNKSWDPAINLNLDTGSWQIAHSKEISSMLESKLICGSNPDFDKRMIAAECFRTGQPRPKWGHRGVNTCSFGMLLWAIGETPGAGLGHLTTYFKIEHKAHTALGDCHAAIDVWEAFYDKWIMRPQMMKEALEELERGGTTGNGYRWAAGGVIEICRRGLRGTP